VASVERNYLGFDNNENQFRGAAIRAQKYWVFQKGMYSLIGGKLEKASSARKN
jgi:hypothetical protein